MPSHSREPYLLTTFNLFSSLPLRSNLSQDTLAAGRTGSWHVSWPSLDAMHLQSISTTSWASLQKRSAMPTCLALVSKSLSFLLLDLTLSVKQGSNTTIFDGCHTDGRASGQIIARNISTDSICPPMSTSLDTSCRFQVALHHLILDVFAHSYPVISHP